MSFGAPSPPAVPDPNVVAKNQQQLNLDMLKDVQAASNVNQVTPTGSLTYTQTGVGPDGVPTYTATQKLSDAQQALLNTMQGTQLTAGTQAGNLLSNANYGAAGTDPSKIIGDATGGNTKALLGQETSYLDPYFTSQTSQLDTKLRNQGIVPGSPAYTQAMQQNQDTQNRAVTNFLSTAEPQAYQQAYQSYMTPLSMAGAELGISNPAGLGLTSTPQASGNPADLVGATSSANAANMAAYQAQVQQQNAMMSGLFGIGGAALSGGTGGFGSSLLGSLVKSDRHHKNNITQVGSMFDGTPIYRFQYNGLPNVWHIGVMAQDIEEFEPEAVRIINGIKHVDYYKATQRAVDHGI
jgi:hypothetical protein